ncbi:hypothetical protein BC937DRAFT_86569 [Endogone sp. FLAS-F59071]|nr:hypothetical protein BC937DRAFT_86569 [Endogone sp. FLAS-F59071]|eukprot:RUS20007.1 hypothetical protein BC937DRAFT_86569 [Endogone sp. FLAS-F59071]
MLGWGGKGALGNTCEWNGSTRRSERLFIAIRAPYPTHLECSLTPYGDEQTALLPLRFGVVDRQVRASHDAELYLTVDYQGKADSKLSATQKAHGTVDGVKGPLT